MSYEILNVIPMAILMSFGHCLGMCGGFVIAYNTRLSKKTKFQAFLYSLSYHFSRVLAYTTLGFFAGFFGSFFKINHKFIGFLHFFVGIFLVILAIALIKRGEILKFIENDKLWRKFFAKPTKNAMSNSSIFGFAMLGFLNGFLPCGVVYTALAMAIMSANALYGASLMFIFGIFTMPTMIGFSFLTNLINQKFRNYMFLISACLIFIYGIFLSYKGFMATL